MLLLRRGRLTQKIISLPWMLDLYFEILYVEILLWQAPCDDRANESSDYVISKISRILEMKKIPGTHDANQQLETTVRYC